MSEQTPNSSEDLSGAEPSMEDILASIRKIISDDEPVALESPEDVPTVSVVDTDAQAGPDEFMRDIRLDSNDLTSDAVIDAAGATDAAPTMQAESVDLNIDDVLAGLDGDVLGFEPEEIDITKTDMSATGGAEIETLDVSTDTGEIDALDIESLIPVPGTVESRTPEIAADLELQVDDSQLLDFLDAEIPVETETIAAQLDTPSDNAELTSSDDFDDDLDMDALLDDILMTPADAQPADAQDDVVDVTAAPAMQESKDLDLVKSLMADLADDPDGFETEEDLDALLAIPEVEETAEAEAEADPEAEIAAAEAASDDAAEDDILGDILNMTLDDELQTHPDDIPSAKDEYLASLDAVVEAEQENMTANAADADDDLPSLSEIAAAAEADAAAAEMAKAPQAVAATAGLGAAAGLAALGATALGETPAETETETAETYSEPSPEPIPTQETSMPVQAVKTDAILDDVTEAATAGAFAELNQVVEDKAIFNERGPRIGDLVQEALRPMLKEWLDANLKGIVERAVAKEVKRISSGK